MSAPSFTSFPPSFSSFPDLEPGPSSRPNPPPPDKEESRKERKKHRKGEAKRTDGDRKRGSTNVTRVANMMNGEGRSTRVVPTPGAMTMEAVTTRGGNSRRISGKEPMEWKDRARRRALSTSRTGREIR